MTILKIALVQQQNSADYAANIEYSVSMIRSAAQKRADLVVLQELHTSLYFCQNENSENFNLSEPIPGKTTDILSKTAKETSTVIVGSIFEKRASGIYHNTAVIFDRDGSMAGIYRKMHIPDDPSYYEKYYFAPGDLGFKPIKTSVATLGVLVCWDQWFPEAARLMTLSGAQLLIFPTAIGWDPRDTKEQQEKQRNAWMTIQRGHAIANSLPVISVNRVGVEADPTGLTPGIRFWGSSFACDGQGAIISQAPNDRPALEIIEIDLDQTEKIRRVWPYLRDRRIDAYQNLANRYSDFDI